MACCSFAASSPSFAGDFFCHLPGGGKYDAPGEGAAPARISGTASNERLRSSNRSIVVKFLTLLSDRPGLWPCQEPQELGGARGVGWFAEQRMLETKQTG